jgi:hypothetical protein
VQVELLASHIYHLDDDEEEAKQIISTLETSFVGLPVKIEKPTTETNDVKHSNAMPSDCWGIE